MLGQSLPHAAFRENTLARLQQLSRDDATAKRMLVANAELASKILICDLDPIYPVLARLYSPAGRPGRDPCTLFRGLMLMNWLGHTEFEPWVKELATYPLWAVLCGFEPDDPPGASTFRDFLRRLTRTWHQRRKLKKPRRSAKRRGAAKKGQKLSERHAGVVQRLLEWLPKRAPAADTLNQILALFARASADRGLFDPLALHLAGDGTPLLSFTNPNGRRTCEHAPGSDCGCRRKFSDPEAAWGWDSHNEVWFWGYHIYEVAVRGKTHDLPLVLQKASAARNDAVSFVATYFNFRRLYPDWLTHAWLLDSAHDQEAIYLRLRQDDALPIIDLNARGRQQPPADPLHPPMNKAGVPICAAGHDMAPNGTSRGRGVWSCPALRVRKGITCELPCKHQRVYTTAASFLRVFPGVHRDSPAWHQLYNDRTAVERSHKRKLRDFNQEFGRTRTASSRVGLYFFAAYCQHVDAWFAEAPQIEPAIREVIGSLNAA